MTEQVKSVPAVSIILTPKYQHESGVKGPNFEEVKGVYSSEIGFHVVCDDLNTGEKVEYIYPVHTIARIKLNKAKMLE